MTTKRILIIDDEERIREVVSACLEDLGGWETAIAASGMEGLSKAQQKAFDAIILDVSMPDLDGFTIFQKLQTHSATQSIPVILLTAKVLPEDKAKFAAMDVAGVLTKPFNPVTISTQVAQLLGWNS